MVGEWLVGVQQVLCQLLMSACMGVVQGHDSWLAYWPLCRASASIYAGLLHCPVWCQE